MGVSAWKLSIERWHRNSQRLSTQTKERSSLPLAFTSRLEAAGIRVSMAGHGRALDNVFVERLWRSVKYEHVYLYEYAAVPELEEGLHEYFTFYNHERPHQSLSYQTPPEVHFVDVSCHSSSVSSEGR